MADFGTAVKELKNDKVIYRKPWMGTKLFLLKKRNFDIVPVEDTIMAVLWNGKNVSWVPNHEDLLADDWIIDDGMGIRKKDL